MADGAHNPAARAVPLHLLRCCPRSHPRVLFHEQGGQHWARAQPPRGQTAPVPAKLPLERQPFFIHPFPQLLCIAFSCEKKPLENIRSHCLLLPADGAAGMWALLSNAGQQPGGGAGPPSTLRREKFHLFLCKRKWQQTSELDVCHRNFFSLTFLQSAASAKPYC